LFVLVLCNLVFAASETSSTFSIGSPTEEAIVYIPSASYLELYWGYLVIGLIVLVFAYFVFRAKVKRKVSKRKVKRKVSKKKTSKKKKKK